MLLFCVCVCISLSLSHLLYSASSLYPNKPTRITFRHRFVRYFIFSFLFANGLNDSLTGINVCFVATCKYLLMTKIAMLTPKRFSATIFSPFFPLKMYSIRLAVGAWYNFDFLTHSPNISIGFFLIALAKSMPPIEIERTNEMVK